MRERVPPEEGFRVRLTDEATAYKAFRTSLLHQMRLECRRFEFCPEVTAKLRRLGFPINEVPIASNARGLREGKKIRARDGFAALWTLLRFRLAPRRSLVHSSSPAAPPAPRLSL